jgi:hypothetical protein
VQAHSEFFETFDVAVGCESSDKHLAAGRHIWGYNEGAVVSLPITGMRATYGVTNTGSRRACEQFDALTDGNAPAAARTC